MLHEAVSIEEKYNEQLKLISFFLTPTTIFLISSLILHTIKGVHERTGSDNACVRACCVKLSFRNWKSQMEIAESVPTGKGCVRQATKATCDKILNFYNFTRAL